MYAGIAFLVLSWHEAIVINSQYSTSSGLLYKQNRLACGKALLSLMVFGLKSPTPAAFAVPGTEPKKYDRSYNEWVPLRGGKYFKPRP